MQKTPGELEKQRDGKRRKEGALSPMPKDKADHPDLLGKGDGQSRATMVTNLQESRE